MPSVPFPCCPTHSLPFLFLTFPLLSLSSLFCQSLCFFYCPILSLPLTLVFFPFCSFSFYLPFLFFPFTNFLSIPFSSIALLSSNFSVFLSLIFLCSHLLYFHLFSFPVHFSPPSTFPFLHHPLFFLSFNRNTPEAMLYLCDSMTRPHLEYAVQLRPPNYRTDIELLERVQRRATKIIPPLRETNSDDSN